MRNQNFFNLPTFSLNVLFTAGGFFIVCLGIRVVKASDIALQVADTQLVTSNSANRLEQLARELEEQAKIIEQKDTAYRELQVAYEEYLHNRKGDIELGEKIEAIDKLPKVEDINNIKAEIQETEVDLLEITEE